MRRLALEWTVGKPFGRAPTACGQGGQGEMGEQNRGGVYEGGWKGGTVVRFSTTMTQLSTPQVHFLCLALEILPGVQYYTNEFTTIVFFETMMHLFPVFPSINPH